LAQLVGHPALVNVIRLIRNLKRSPFFPYYIYILLYVIFRCFLSFLLLATRKKFHFVKQKNGQAGILLGCQKDLTCHVFPGGFSRRWGFKKEVGGGYAHSKHADRANSAGLALSTVNFVFGFPRLSRFPLGPPPLPLFCC